VVLEMKVKRGLWWFWFFVVHEAEEGGLAIEIHGVVGRICA